MKKIVFVFLLVILGAIVILAQKGEENYRQVKNEYLNFDLERECYYSTTSFKEFKRCVEKPRFPACLKERLGIKDLGGTMPVFPCRNEKKYFLEETDPIQPV